MNFPPPPSAPTAWGSQSTREDAVAQVFIGKVPGSVDLGLLEQQLVPLGAVNVRMPPGKSCAFADFRSWDEAEQAIGALNGLKLDIHASEGLNVKFADQKGQGGVKNKEPQKPKVFIGGLAHTVTDDMVFQVACQFGQVLEAKIYAKRPESPPCGFVLFSSFAEAEICIQHLHGMESELGTPGKALNVRMADQQGLASQGVAVVGVTPGPAKGSIPMPMPPAPPAAPMPPMVGGNFGFGGGGGKAGGGFGGGAPQGFGGGAPQVGRPSTGGPGCPPPPAHASQKLFIGNLPEAASEDFVWGMMAPYGEVIEAKIHRKTQAAPCGFVRFSSPAEAEVAMAAHGQLGKFTVKPADDNRGGGQNIGQFTVGNNAYGPKRNYDAAFGKGSGKSFQALIASA